MNFDLEKVESACLELNFGFERVGQGRIDVTVVENAILSFQNFDDDCAAGFLDCPWHFHDNLVVRDSAEVYVQYSAEDIILGLRLGELLLAEREVCGERKDLWIVGKEQINPGKLDAGERFSLLRVSKGEQ